MVARALSPLLTLGTLLAAATASPTATAVLKDATGKEVGTATFTSARSGVLVKLVATGLPPGKHGLHLHAAGKCEPPDFKSAGGHFNPGAKQHGLHNPGGHHAGDLPNLVVAKDGTARASFTARGATLSEGQASLLGPDGAAIVVHADADDERTDPAGNSGARIACGVIERK